MPSNFFEIDPRYINTDHKGEDKYTPEEYSQMTDSLKNVQGLMDTGVSGKEILSQHPDRSPTGIAETYKQFYNPEQGSRVKVDVDADGNLFCGNGKHRCESAKEKDMYVPAEVRCSDEKQLADVENKYGSGRDLSQFNPRDEQNQLDREQTPPNWDEFRSRYTDNTSVNSDSENNKNNELMSQYTNDNRSMTSAPPDLESKTPQLKDNYSQPLDNTRSSDSDREDLQTQSNSDLNC
jgi:hypothetical protein